jgi:putative ABC transport system permease protein
MTLVARSNVDPERLTQSIRAAITAIDPELPFYGTRPMQARIDESLVGRRTPMLLGASFAIIAVFLACIGIYGVLAYQVAQRRREIGIRLALGSDGPRIFRLIVREGLMLLGLGVIAGLAGSVTIRRAMETQLFGVQALDPVVLGSVAALLGLVAFTACAVPARRATRIDPVIALTDQ